MLSPKCEVVNFLLSTGLYFTKGSPQKVSDQSAKKCVKFGHKQKCDIYCHKQRGTLWLGTCPNPPPPYKLSHKLKEKSNLINMLMIIVLFFFLIMACHNSKCLLWVPNDRSSYSYMCVWRWTLYSLWESTLSSEWFCDTNLIRGCDINSVFCFFIEALLEPLTYLKEYNCHGFCLNYILGCDI